LVAASKCECPPSSEFPKCHPGLSYRFLTSHHCNSQLTKLSQSLMLRPTVSRPVCLGVKHPSGAQDQIFITGQTVAGLLMWGALTRERFCTLQLLLLLASRAILRTESRETRDHILLSQIRDSSNLEGQVPIFISPRNRVSQLYPQAPGSLFVASYDSQGYGGCIRYHLHAGYSPS
jgi:hypothetical protein